MASGGQDVAVADGGVEFEVEDILKYRRNEDGTEYFYVKWLGYPVSESTWEPLEHMNENCLELIAKARAHFAWQRPSAVAAAAAEQQPRDQGGQQPLLPPHPQHPPSAAQGGGHQPVMAASSPDVREDARSHSGTNGGGGYMAPSDLYLKRRPQQLTMQPAAPSKRPKVSVEAPQERVQRPCTELKCVCGVNEPLRNGAFNRNIHTKCKICNCALHTRCVQAAIGGSTAPLDEVVCPPCRLERVDEFHLLVGPGILEYNYADRNSIVTLNFNAQAAQWKKQNWALHLRCVSTASVELGGPAWPFKVTGKLNGKPCVEIQPPKHLHVRREQCYNLTPLVKQGVNRLEMKFHPKPERDNGPEESYCVGVVLTKPRTVSSIIASIKARSTETVESGRQRVAQLLNQVAERDAAAQDECKVTGNFGRILKPVCPVSLCPIEEAAIGSSCNHVQVFDLTAYIQVNQRMRSLDKRWTCPVCSLACRPDDIVLDRFVQGILDTVQGEEESVESIVLNDDCTWSLLRAVKEDRERHPQTEDDGGNNGEGGSPPAELIALSDSE